MLRYTDAAGNRHELRCDVIAGCDGFHGVCRPAIPASLLQVAGRGYPYAWLGILADVPPSTDELIYARHQAGFALHTMRSPQVSRLYLQVARGRGPRRAGRMTGSGPSCAPGWASRAGN